MDRVFWLIAPFFAALWYGGWLGLVVFLTLYALIFGFLFRGQWQSWESWQTKTIGKQFLLIIGLLVMTHLIILILFSGIIFLVNQFF